MAEVAEEHVNENAERTQVRREVLLNRAWRTSDVSSSEAQRGAPEDSSPSRAMEKKKNLCGRKERQSSMTSRLEDLRETNKRS